MSNIGHYGRQRGDNDDDVDGMSMSTRVRKGTGEGKREKQAVCRPSAYIIDELEGQVGMSCCFDSVVVRFKDERSSGKTALT